MDGENANRYIERDYVTPDINSIQQINLQQQERIKKHSRLTHDPQIES